jgi:hypothetical protein
MKPLSPPYDVRQLAGSLYPKAKSQRPAPRKRGGGMWRA